MYQLQIDIFRLRLHTNTRICLKGEHVVMLFGSKIDVLEKIQPFTESDLEIQDMGRHMQQILKLIQLTQKEKSILQKISPLMKEHAPEMAKRHYGMIMELPQIKPIFEANSNFERYTKAIINYYNQLSNTRIDKEYVEYRKKIGQIHSRIHLTDEWFIGSYIRVYEYLLPIIIKEFHRSPSDLSDILLALIKIITFDSLIVLSSYQEANDFALVQNISKVMDYVISIDKVKGLLQNVGSSLTEAVNVSAAAQELNASVQEVAQNAVQVAENATDMIREANIGKDVIESSLNGFIQIADDFLETKDKIEQLINQVLDISKVVGFIKGIAEETNLLALNASIEAARAGESGRGFAVVANEVRKLAEQTKSSVEQISETIQQIQTDAHVVGKIVESMSTNMSERVGHTQAAIETLNKIVQEIDLVGDSTSNIAAIAEQQSAATNNIATHINNVHENMEEVRQSAEETGKSIYEVSLEVNHLRRETIAEILEPTPLQISRVIQTEHLLWRWRIYNAELGFNELHESDIDYRNSYLTKWLESSKSNSDYTASTILKDIEREVQYFYQVLSEICDQFSQGNKENTDGLMRKYEESSKRMQSLLQTL
jgi:methyl-accepting chemotaxis protein